jgi:hypothetical protein
MDLGKTRPRAVWAAGRGSTLAADAIPATCRTESPPYMAAQSAPRFRFAVGIVLFLTSFGLVRGCLRLFFKAMPFFVQHRIEFFDEGQ